MMAGLLVYACVTLSIVQTSLSQSAPGPVVSVKNWSLRGASMTVKGSDKQVQQYLGIPFARPPLGPLRLSAPQPAESWEGERDATQQPPMCLQDPDVVPKWSKNLGVELSVPPVSEDCLYLNVYTPAKSTDDEKLPVMVWIHGGAYLFGAASQYDGSVLAAYENLVVVIVQYRLGILGFFSTGDEHAQGNWGLLDQIAALQWVQQNIGIFGGDPNSVTIAGESAGGMSTSFLVLSPLSKGLFHRAVLQSGSATVAGYSTNTPAVFAQMVANVTDCDSSSTEALVQCLRQKNEEELINVMKKKIPASATVDGKFLPAPAEQLLSSKDFLKVPILIGVTNHEFGWSLPKAFFPGGLENIDRAMITGALGRLIPSGVASGVNEIIVDEYLKDAKTPEDIRDASLDLLGDLFLVIPAIKVANYHRDAGVPVYMYEFQHRPEIYKDTRPSFVKADHGDELGFVFGACFWNGHVKLNGSTTEGENQLCRTVMSYWANFARNGSPNGPGLVHWPLYDASNKYLNLDLQQSEGQDLRKDKMQFFTVELPKRLAAKANSKITLV
ncbi:carboxylesterase 5A-like [Clupea harengus]|uniref:Carboxylic ester hydrolase n=1 Tax=Clupea harengus TaxID=7950 RepID=A0A6P3W4G9_CLUHA|nr:carboxylesterase 5A-like [Clupea harengus]